MLQPYQNYSEYWYMAGGAGVIGKMISWVVKKFSYIKYANNAIKFSKEKSEHTRENIHKIKSSMDGEDRWFLRLCDSEDPHEAECPPDYDDLEKE